MATQADDTLNPDEQKLLTEGTLADRAIQARPRDFYRAIRKGDPIHYDKGLNSWLVTRHEDISAVQSDPVTFSVQHGYSEQQARGMQDEFRAYLGMKHSAPFVPDAIAQMRAAVAPEGAFTVLVAGFADGALDDDPDLDRQALGDALSDALAAAGAALGEIVAWLEADYLPRAVAADGVGRERYRRHARSFLGTDLDLDDTYRWGWDHLLEIRAEMESIAAELDPSTDLAGVVEAMDTDAETVAASPEEFRTLMLDRERRAMRDLDGTHFDIPAEIRAIDVKLAPLGSALGAYFIPPSEDFSRPGTTWWSLGEQTRVPLWSEVTTAYHEGFPGHHLQCGIQTCLGERLSRVHRLLFWLPGYGEGWALYAERLMRELGYLDRPEYVLGLLASNALRAVRVVIDIGCHLDLPMPTDVPFHPGEPWTYELGVEALEHYAFLTHPLAESEVTRYLGWPGQAIAYKVGERAILELREAAREAEGDAFDLKSFHERVLGSGPVGLDHLRDIVLGA